MADTTNIKVNLNRQVNLSAKGYQWVCDMFADQLQSLYDDPWASDTESLKDIQQEVTTMREVAVSLGIDFDSVVKAETTEYERARIALYMQHTEWTSLLEHRLEALFDDESLSHMRYANESS